MGAGKFKISGDLSEADLCISEVTCSLASFTSHSKKTTTASPEVCEPVPSLFFSSPAVHAAVTGGPYYAHHFASKMSVQLIESLGRLH